MSETKRKVPKLRFPGFMEDWEQRKLGEITVNIGKRNKDNLNLEPYAITKDDGFIPQADAHDEFGYMKETDRKAYNIVKPNSFGYNPARINVGSIGYYSGSEDIIVSSLYEIFQTSDNIYDRFLWQWLKSKQFQNWIERLQEGSVRLYFYYDKLCECEIFIPTVDEQIKIGNSLDRLDNLITLHQRKLENLKLKKKALLQKLFPKNGEQFPEFRFPGFTNAWEQRKLCEVAEITMGQSPSSKNYTDNPEDFILVQGNADLKNGAVVPRLWTKEVTKTAEANSIILTVRAPVGEVAISGYDVVLGRGVAGIKGNDFIYYVLLCLKEFHYWEKLSSGSTFDSINSNDIKEILINMPDEKEQEVITSQLKNVDNLITLHQRKLEHLQLQKKALLQQMFV